MRSFKHTIVFAAAAGIFAGAAHSAYAGASNCQIIYGGGEVCQKAVSFTLDKKVQKPTKGGEFVDNLGVNDEKFAPGATINYKITVKNTGDSEITNINVLDELPQYLSWVSGGNLQGNNVSYTIDKLAPGQSRSFDLSAKVADTNNLPTDKNIICVTNKVKATQNDNTATDSSEACIEKGVVPQKEGGPVVQPVPPIQQTPQTGAGFMSLIALLPTGALGIYLNRRSK